tara:strand:+ start:1620 stop:3212 length:1593 start_codon:yes stop_codon:yes gene_type:complete
MVFEEEEEYGYDDEDIRQSDDDPVWTLLSSEEKKTLMKNCFSDDGWYEDGTPFHKGGNANPRFAIMSEKCGAPIRTIKKYYAAWLKKKNLVPSEAFNNPASSEPQQSSYGQSGFQSSYSTPPPTSSIGSSTLDRSMDNMFDQAVEQQVANSGNSDAMGMMFMMKFLGEQQQMAMQQSQFQMMQMMEQRRLDQQRESDMRREQLARDQQFMTQQLTLMKDTMKRGSEDGFFDNEMKGIFKERMVDNLLGGDKDESWRDTVKEVIGSDTVKSAVAGIGTAMSSRRQIPAGYDQPDYNPYAQPQMPQQVDEQTNPPQMGEYSPLVETNDAPTDGVFFGDENATQQVQQVPTEQVAPPVQQEPEIKEYSEDEYKKILFQTFTTALGPAAEDEKVIQALQQQCEVAVVTTMMEQPDALPHIKLHMMSEKMLIVRNLRDIGMGLMELKDKTPPGEAPSGILIGAIVSELRKNPEFYRIFATNTYDELMAKIEPFKETGAIAQDYNYLLQPEVSTICRALLGSVALDSQQPDAPKFG